MVLYNFKSIPIVPTATDFIDIVLSRTQRQTPTVCHGGWKISRIRQFYMRKVKHTQSTWHDGLSKILNSFPQVSAIHPFYADLLNVLYDRDHYKLALGQLNVAKNLIDKLTQDYVRLLKYGDSQYRCKQLKRAALVSLSLQIVSKLDLGPNGDHHQKTSIQSAVLGASQAAHVPPSLHRPQQPDSPPLRIPQRRKIQLHESGHQGRCRSRTVCIHH